MIEEIFKQTDISDIISSLKKKNVIVPKWEDLRSEYDVMEHEVMTDQIERKDRKGVKAARITYGMQKLATRRMTQMAFTLPVKRTYKHGNDSLKMEQAKALERLYYKARIDSLNKKRFKAYFASCEMATIWYVVEQDNNDYGFNSKYKLRQVTYSPMDEKFSGLEQAEIYPLFDEYGDMIALSVEFMHKEDEKEVYYFETYTSEKKYSWKKVDGVWIDNGVSKVPIGKIQGAYIKRSAPIWEDQTNNIREIEYTLSRQSDIIRRNTAPVMKVKGRLIDTPAPQSDVSREVYQFENDGDVDYVKPPVDHESVDSFVNTLKNNIAEELQLPSLALKDITSIGLTEESRKQILIDAHLKVGEEEGDIIEFLSREGNVLKAFLGLMNAKWKDSIGELEVEHEIVPFVMNNETTDIENLSKATGGKPIMSQRTAIQRAGYISEEEIDEEIKRIREEEEASLNTDLFQPTF
jgi:hypothetical protein